MSDNLLEQIRILYTDPQYGLTNQTELLKRAKKMIDKNITMAAIKEAMQGNPNVQTKNPTHSIIPSVGEWQGDLTFYPKVVKQNGGVIGLLTLIETLTRYAYVYPIKNKTASEIMSKLKDWMQKEKPDKLIVDRGTEFNNQQIINLLGDIIDFKQVGSKGTAMVERFNRTIRDKISRYWNTFGTFNYIDVLPELVKNYNNSFHTGVKGVPAKIRKNTLKQNEIRESAIDRDMDARRRWQSFNVGDKVQILLPKDNMFEKGRRQWSSKVYTIKGKQGYSFEVGYKRNRNPYLFRSNELRKVGPEGGIWNIEQFNTERKQNKTENTVKNLNKRSGLTTDKQGEIKFDNWRMKPSNKRRLKLGDTIVSYWEDLNEWLKGTVKKINTLKNVEVLYEDGDTIVEDLSPQSDTVWSFYTAKE